MSATKKFQAALKEMGLKLSREEAKKMFYDYKAIMRTARKASQMDLVCLLEESKEKGLEDALQLIMYAKEIQS